jgi:hypothetical protein
MVILHLVDDKNISFWNMCWYKPPLVKCVSIVTSALVIIEAITYGGISFLSLLMINKIVLVIWIPTIYGICISGMIGCSGTK